MVDKECQTEVRPFYIFNRFKLCLSEENHDNSADGRIHCDLSGLRNRSDGDTHQLAPSGDRDNLIKRKFMFYLLLILIF